MFTKKLMNCMKSRAQESTNAIERMYVTMRHLFTRGFYKPMGVSGVALRESLLVLRPEIYGSIAESKTELNGLIYVLDRLPEGIEQCKYINLIADEGYRKSHFKPIIPPKRRRNCYRIDEQQINIEITRGRSDIYDVLTHLTFLFVESHKIANRTLLEDNKISHDWEKLEAAVAKNKLTLAEREEISRGLAKGLSIWGIAQRINRAASSVSREISRNKGRENYRAVDAQDRAIRARARPQKLPS